MSWRMTQKKRRGVQPRHPRGTRRGGQFMRCEHPLTRRSGPCSVIGPCNMPDPDAPTFWERMRRRLRW